MRNYFYYFGLLLFATIVKAQQPNDCINAIKICGNGVFTSNASGIGNVQEVSGCGGFESNSIWLKITIAQGGTLGFDIKPLNTNLETDYDFWVYSPNNTCSALGSPIRCCTTNPLAAGLTNNHTGLISSSIQTTSGPGANGNGYVRWLNVEAGQTYYIAIDRPHGDGGFELQWTGTALLTTAPVANDTADFETCSNTPDEGFFDLDFKRSQINSDLTNNTINFFTTLANAVDNVSALPNIISNTSNPQLIYARVTDNSTGCFSLTQFNLIVYTCLGIPSSSESNNRIVVYPNPFDNDFVIDFESEKQELLKIKVYDLLGKLVEQRTINNGEINTQRMGQNYPSGIYNVVVINENDSKTFKIIKR